MANRKICKVSEKNLLAPWERICHKCGGRLESKGIRRETRRYRCVKCKSNAASIPISEDERSVLRANDKGIKDLTLTERYEEIRGLERKKQAYCLLPEYDPKYSTTKLIKSRFRHNHSEVLGYQDWLFQMEKKKDFSRKIRQFWKKRMQDT